MQKNQKLIISALINFFIFDVNYIPFKANSISDISLYLGFDNMFNDTRVFHEIKRLNVNTFYYFNVFQYGERQLFENTIIKNQLEIFFSKGVTLQYSIGDNNYFFGCYTYKLKNNDAV